MSTLVDTVALSLDAVHPGAAISGIVSALREPPAAILQSRSSPPTRRPGDVRPFARSRARRGARRARPVGHRFPSAWTDAAISRRAGRHLRSTAAALDPRGTATAFDATRRSRSSASRAGSPYALAVAERLAGDLAARGVLVVSGLARGVDSAAHRGALASGGADRRGPRLGRRRRSIRREHAALAASIAASGALVSELAPGTRPLQWFFPLRNRIISGLSRAVVVIEAGEKSGSLITARCALEQGRDVLAVPGSVLGGRNRGGHALLRDGARIVESADDILDELNLRPRCASREPTAGSPASQAAAVPNPHGRSWARLSVAPGEPSDLEAISARSRAPARLICCRGCSSSNSRAASGGPGAADSSDLTVRARV